MNVYFLSFFFCPYFDRRLNRRCACSQNAVRYIKTVKIPLASASILGFVFLFVCTLVFFSLMFAPLRALAQPPAPEYPLLERAADAVPLLRYAERRRRLVEKMSAKSFALFFAADKRLRQNDVYYEYRQSSDLLYLTGFDEPESVLALIPGGVVLPSDLDSSGARHEALLFVQKRDATQEMWSGAITGADRAERLYGVKALENIHVASVIESLLSPEDSTQRRDTVFITTFPTSAVVEPLSGDVVNIEREAKIRLQNRYPKAVIRSQKRLLADMRQIKDADEIVLLRKAVNITLEGYRAAFKALRPGVWEYELEAAMEGTFKRLGAEDVGYASIIGSGGNACILHYTGNRRQAQAGELVLMDCGAEAQGYTADITRTVPVSGVFTTEQRAVYDIVYAAQEAAIKEYRKGVDWRLPHSRAVETIRAGLLRLGIISSPDEYAMYFPHGSVHYIGLDVHDAGNYATFQPGMTLTCEPGIYIPAGSPCDKKWWNIGVRIEDDILVTDGEPVVLSAALPRSAQEIEDYMRGLRQNGENSRQSPLKKVSSSTRKK
jgi:Xaa-Pro aminopeptidase